jgi:hypothetical protein
MIYSGISADKTEAGESGNVHLGTAVTSVDSGWEKVGGLEDESVTLDPGV